MKQKLSMSAGINQGNSRMIQCNYPGCNEHSMESYLVADWNCGKHITPVIPLASHLKWCEFRIWKEKHSYLPSRHPQHAAAPKCTCGLS
jgi:hypothetical protein